MIIGHRFLLLIPAIGLFGLTACANPATAVTIEQSAAPAPLGIDLGASSRAPARMIVSANTSGRHVTAPDSSISPVADAQAEAHAVGVVNSVDAARKRINLSHGPIPAIGWPAMTMDFAVLPSVDLGKVKPGDKIDATLQKGKNDSYEIRSVQPAAR